ncbi:MAG: ATP-dependent RecD-like DNA helicase, partial [Clostridia bacterium]|nr:ATP-dependent RecD-like DNA helicase [Clostridia bacterium]
MEIKKDENRTEGLETLEGIVENIIYQNSENGYTVLDMSVEGDDLPKTVVGIIPQIAEGESIKVMGKWDLHSTYGKQLKVEYYERRQPIGKEAILRYLSARTIKGIGPKTAQRIVERFGDETLNVIESSPEFLADIDGISYAKAMEIGKIYKEQFGMRNVIIFASEFFGMATALKIYKKWGSSAVDIIKSNPYILCDGIDGVGFARADKVARSLGGAIDSPDRVRSGM